MATQALTNQRTREVALLRLARKGAAGVSGSGISTSKAFGDYGLTGSVRRAVFRRRLIRQVASACLVGLLQSLCDSRVFGAVCKWNPKCGQICTNVETTRCDVRDSVTNKDEAKSLCNFHSALRRATRYGLRHQQSCFGFHSLWSL